MHIPTEKFAANMDGSGKDDLVGMFIVATMYDDASDDAFGEVVHSKSGENLLKNVFHFFGMECGKANRIL